MAERGGTEKRGRLNRPLVLATAVALVDRDGLAALTMRRLAGALGVESMAIYRYTPGKEALLDGLVEAFFAEVNDLLRDTVEPDDGRTTPGTAGTPGRTGTPGTAGTPARQTLPGRSPPCRPGGPNCGGSPARSPRWPTPTPRSCRWWPSGR